MPSAPEFGAIDLNLLRVLDVVLETKSATRAAQRLHVTQSAVSSALRRLREALGDALFVRSARGLVPTPRAAAMAVPLRAWLDQARALVESGVASQAIQRSFTVAAADAYLGVLLPRLTPSFARRFPSSRLGFITPERMLALGGLAAGAADLLVGTPRNLPAGCRAETLYEDRMSCILRRGHAASRKWTLDAYASLPHCEVALFGEPNEAVDRALARHGRTRRVAVTVPHFAAVPLVVEHGDCVATLPERMLRLFTSSRLCQREPPIAVPIAKPVVAWHSRVEGDAAVAELRRLIHAAVESDRHV